MPIEAAIDLKRCDLKNVKQVLRRPMTLLVTLYWLTIGLTYVRAGLTYKPLRTHAHKHYVFPSQGGGGTCTHPSTHLVCLRFIKL